MFNMKNLSLFFNNFYNNVLSKFNSIVNIFQNEANLLNNTKSIEYKIFTDNNIFILNPASYAFNNRQRHS